MKCKLILLLFFIHTYTFAQTAKIDLNMEGRKDAEVNETGYTSWFVPRVHSSGITLSGITFTLTATSPGPTPAFRAGWSKLLVQTPYLMKLVNDGIKVDNDTMLLYPDKGAGIELRISGLPIGKHSIQTYHNLWEDTTTVRHCPINVYANGSLVHSNIVRSVLVKSTSDATRLLTEVEITQAGQDAILQFDAVTSFNSNGKKADYNVNINAIELNTDDASKQAYDPTPGNGDLHVNADSGSCKLKWYAAKAGDVASHIVYIGTDSATVTNATDIATNVQRIVLAGTVTEYTFINPSNLSTYYWRVDETSSANICTKGRTWSFRPRHIAFRGAEGYGRFATGGRNGKVIYVTNLNDNGPGSFRYAATCGLGPRTIIFNVSGIITLNSKLFIDPFVTIAGQTAPGKGICLRTSSVGIGNESICRFIRMRLGSGTSTDGMGMAGASESIMDHNSISWSIDEGFSSRSAKNITFQHNLISEALNVAGLDNYEEGHAHGYAAVIGGNIASFHHNMIAHCYGRNPRMDGGMDGLNYYTGRLDIFNNVVYNWMISAAYGEAHEANFVNNYYKQGPATDKTLILAADINQRQSNLGTETYYVKGNVLELKNKSFYCDGTVADCGITTRTYGTMDFNWTFLVNNPFYPSYAKTETAYEAYKSVLSDVGCSMPVLDDHDKRVIYETQTGTARYSGSITQKGGIIDTEADAGGYEDYGSETRPAGFDTDGDGLPDWWETMKGTNLQSAANDFSESNADPDGDGYTNLEDYLEWMATPHYYIKPGGECSVNLSQFSVGYTKSPQFTVRNQTGLYINTSGNLLNIKDNANPTGIYYFDVHITDSEGATTEKRLGVCISNNDFTALKELISANDLFSITPVLFDTYISFKGTTSDTREITVCLKDLTGRRVIEQTSMMQTGTNEQMINGLHHLPSQIYLFTITDKKSGKTLYKNKVLKK